MSDTWSDIQEHKRKQESLRERLQKRRRERQGIGVGDADGIATPPPGSPQAPDENNSIKAAPDGAKVDSRLLENSLIECLWDSTFILPVDSIIITNYLLKKENAGNPNRDAVQNLLEKFAIQDFVCIKPGTAQDGKPCIIVTEKDHSKLDAVAQELNISVGFQSQTRRRVFTLLQRIQLEALFCNVPYPSAFAYKELAERFGVSVRSLKIWFKNRRAKNRKTHPNAPKQRLRRTTHEGWVPKSANQQRPSDGCHQSLPCEVTTEPLRKGTFYACPNVQHQPMSDGSQMAVTRASPVRGRAEEHWVRECPHNPTPDTQLQPQETRPTVIKLAPKTMAIHTAGACHYPLQPTVLSRMRGTTRREPNDGLLLDSSVGPIQSSGWIALLSTTNEPSHNTLHHGLPVEVMAPPWQYINNQTAFEVYERPLRGPMISTEAFATVQPCLDYGHEG